MIFACSRWLSLCCCPHCMRQALPPPSRRRAAGVIRRGAGSTCLRLTAKPAAGAQAALHQPRAAPSVTGAELPPGEMPALPRAGALLATSITSSSSSIDRHRAASKVHARYSAGCTRTVRIQHSTSVATGWHRPGVHAQQGSGSSRADARLSHGTTPAFN